MILYILGAFLLSLLLGLVFTPLILKICKTKKLYDIPNERKIHKNAIPRLGGISFLPSMLTTTIIVLIYMSFTEQKTLPVNLWSAMFVLGLVIIYLTGIIDDLIGLNAITKLSAQIITACLFPIAGLYINNLYGLFGIHEIQPYIGIPLTICVVVFIDNAINLIDGMDGLAAGLSLIAFSGFLVYFIHYGVFLNTYCILSASMIGVIVAFAYFNIFGKPEKNTKTFMGDSGSLSLGYILGFLSIKCAMTNTAIWPMRQEALIVPLTLLFVPLADVIRVIIYRLRHHQPLFKADKNHIHHNLMRMGLTQHQSLVCILSMAIGFILLNSILYSWMTTTLIILIDAVLYCVVNLYINLRTKKAV